MRLFISFFALALPLCGAASDLSIDSAIVQVLANNPNLQAARAKWNSIKARVPQAAAWDDPMLELMIERNDTLNPIKASDAEWKISQKIPLSGKPQARVRVTEAEAVTAYEEVRRVQYDLVSRTRSAFYTFASARERLALNDENRKILSDISEVVQSKIATNETRFSDGLLAQTEISMLEDKRLDIEREAQIAQSTLNTLMNQPASKCLGEPAPLRFRPLQTSYEELVKMALQHRPEMAAARSRVDEETAKIDLAKREGKIDPEFFIAARQMSGSGLKIREYDTGISIPLTWFNRKKYKAMVEEAQALRDSAQYEMEAARLETLEVVLQKYQEASAASKRYLLLKDQVLPQARKTLDALSAEYSSRKATFLEYNNARLVYQNAQIDLFDRLASFNTAQAELHTLTSALSAPVSSSPHP